MADCEQVKISDYRKTYHFGLRGEYATPISLSNSKFRSSPKSWVNSTNVDEHVEKLDRQAHHDSLITLLQKGLGVFQQFAYGSNRGILYEKQYVIWRWNDI